MYIAVKVDSSRNILDTLPQTFDTPRECLNAARAAWGKAGGLQFSRSRLVLL